jgi:membrane dipeptidase
MTSPNGLPVFDGHNDVLLRLYRGGREHESSFFSRGETGHLDLPRAREGGFGGGFFAVYVPPESELLHGADPAALLSMNNGELPPPLELAYSQRIAIGMTALLFRLQDASDGQMKVVQTADDLSECLRTGVMAAVLHFEGAEAIDTDLEALEVFYHAGLRSLGPVWSRPNAFAEGVPFRCPHSPDTGPGLTEVGRALVRECNRLGVVIDLSHMNEQGFWDVAEVTAAPLVASHSNAHALCPITRNLTDKQLDAIRESDGIVGVNFGTGFLVEEGRGDHSTRLEHIIRHVDYLVERVGIDRVGLGSDFDGTTIPAELGSAAGLPRLLDAMRAGGYDDASLRKVAHENWVRVLRKTWR